MRKKKILLLLIILLAACLRLYRLGSYPALNADEAAIGYNAYSLIETGNDEHGNSWPVHFQSFNDYKPGLYFYLVLPFVKFFGLNEWSVRLPNALLGVATVYLVYLLVKELFDGRFAQMKERIDADGMALIAALMLAISPWHIHFSRGGWEVNTATFFIIWGVYLFIKWIKTASHPELISGSSENISKNGKLKQVQHDKFLFFSFLVFSLSLYTYHAARVVVPLVGFGMAVIYWEGIKNNLKTIFIAGLIGVLLLAPLVKDFTKGEIASRAAGVGLFADTGPIARINEQRGEHADFRGLFPIVMHNKPVNYGLVFIENISKHFHGEFLFLSGDVIERNKVPETGQMYPFDLVLLLIGFAFIVLRWGKSKSDDRSWLVILWWLIVASTAAALTFQSPHALRAQNMVIPLVIISAYGMVNIVLWLHSYRNKKILVPGIFLLGVLVFWSFARYEHMYWTHMAKEYPFSSQYGVKELVDYVSGINEKYEKVVVTTTYDQPYILFLFYLKYPPETFQNYHFLTGQDKYGFSTVGEFDKFVFKQIDWGADKLVYRNSLIVGTDDEIPPEANIIERIYGTNGHMYFEIVAN